MFFFTAGVGKTAFEIKYIYVCIILNDGIYLEYFLYICN